VNLPDFSSLPGAIAIDLDGTLLNSQSQLSERNRRAVEACIDQGIPIIIATQRPTRTVRRFLGNELYEDCSLVLLGGAYTLAKPPLSGHFRETIMSSLAREITEVILSINSEVQIIAETGESEFGTNIFRDQDELWKINAAIPEMQLSLDAVITRGVLKIAVDGLTRDLSSTMAAISQQFGNSVSVIPANDTTFLNITNKDASKPKALKKLLDFKQISMDDLVAIGDDLSDFEMLSACGIPIAMANAVPEVKAIAKYQTASNEEDGVAVVIERVLSTTDE